MNFYRAIFSNVNEQISSLQSTTGVARSALTRFQDELEKLLKNYTELVFNPDSGKQLQIGSFSIPGDKIDSPATSLLMDDFNGRTELAQNSLLEIVSKQFKLADKFDALFS